MKLDQIIKDEIVEFRTEELKKTKDEIYTEFYKIHFFEAVYEFLLTHSETPLYLEKLAKMKNPIHWLYDQWLSTDGCFSEDWNDIAFEIKQIINESEE